MIIFVLTIINIIMTKFHLHVHVPYTHYAMLSWSDVYTVVCISSKPWLISTVIIIVKSSLADSGCNL